MNSSPGQIPVIVEKSINTTDFSMYQIVGFAIIFLILASIINFSKNLISTEWSKFYPTNELTGETPLQAALRSQDNVNKSGPATLDYKTLATSSESSPGSSSSSLSQITGELMGAEQPSKSGSAFEGQASAEQTWCLVGEDIAGRWCIQVQSAKACEPIRTYKTKNQCERSSDTPL